MDENSLGSLSKDGLYVAAEMKSDELEDMDTPKVSGSFLGSLFSGKIVTEKDLDPVLEQVINQLISKNVAAEIAIQVCDRVRKSLVGTRISSFSRIMTLVQQEMEKEIQRILTPDSSIFCISS